MGELNLTNKQFMQAIIVLVISMVSLDIVSNIIYGRPLFSGVMTNPKSWMTIIAGSALTYILLVL
jgi:hypothetical protein